MSMFLPFRRRIQVGVVSLAVLSAGVGNALAQLKVEPSSVDLGKQRQEKTAMAVVKLSNSGKKPLQILRVGADCSCTAAAPEKNTLEPGESTELKVSFETRSYQGEISRNVLVQTSEGDVYIPVTALVSPYDSWVLGANLAVFKPSGKGEKAETSFAIEYIGSGKAEIVEVRPSVPWIEARIAEQADGKTKIALTKKPEAPAGNHQPSIVVTTTDPKESQIQFTAFASVHSRLSVTPNPILLPPVKVGQKISIPVSLAGWDGKEDPRGELQGGEVTLRQRDKGDALIDVTVVPSEAGVSTRLLRLYSGQSVEAEIPVIVRGEP